MHNNWIEPINKTKTMTVVNPCGAPGMRSLNIICTIIPNMAMKNVKIESIAISSRGTYEKENMPFAAQLKSFKKLLVLLPNILSGRI